MSDDQNEKPNQYLDNEGCLEVYADTVQVLPGGDGKEVVRIEFCVSRWSQRTPIEVRYVTPVARVAIAGGLADILIEQLKRNRAANPPVESPGVATALSTKH